MDRIAVFVDAGYLYAQGSTALSGNKQARTDLVLDEVALFTDLVTFALSCDAGASLLRIYWYDGLGAGRETPEQQRIAESANVKVRFGVINNTGQQKGVDSLIVTDLVELARANAIASAVVLSGDEDIRIGVEIAQKYGVRVHLLGIVPSRGSQSRSLMREADTTTEWDAVKVSRFLRVVPTLIPSVAIPPPRSPSAAETVVAVAVTTEKVVAVTTDTIVKESLVRKADDASDLDPAALLVLEQAAASVAQTVPGPDIRKIVTDWDARLGLPRTIDPRLLGHARGALGRDLGRSEMIALRKALVEVLRPLTVD